MIARQAIIDSIAHHKRMLAWAEKQNQNKVKVADLMVCEIGESWYAEDCGLCIYANTEKNDFCVACPLYKKYGPCDSSPDNYWKRLFLANTWGEFVEAEKAFIPQLESLLADYPEEQEPVCKP